MGTTLRRPIFVAMVSLPSLCFFLGALNSARGQQLDPTLKAIADAWAKRQAALKTVKVVWRQERTDAHLKQHLRAVSRAKGLEPAPESGGASATTYETVGTLCLDGDSIALTVDIYDPRADALQTPGAGISFHTKSVLEGAEQRRFSVARPGRLHGNASFGPAKSFQDGDLPDIRPLMLALRPLTAQLASIDLATYRVADKRPTLNGVSCLLLEPIKAKGPNRSKISFWVDPARDYLVLREVRTLREQDFRTTDIVYEQHAARAWIPKRWDVVDMYPGTRNFEFAIHAPTLKTIIGEPIAPTEFELGELPVGTLIYDSRSGRLIKSEVEKKPLE
ncbi:MAG TPA: hypothetical protein VG055_00945 [Planctomycetaceae bacterium]|jgi:hypothetical protein|nr:hypothetical protein [Planctomycetaceae bacterium]